MAESDATPVPSRRPLLPPRSCRSAGCYWTSRSAASRRTASDSFARGEHGGCEPTPSGASPRGESPRDDLHQGRCERQPRAGLARPCSGPRERKEDRRENGSFDERPFPTRDGQHVARPERLAEAYSLTDDVRPHVRGPEDQHRPEQRCGHRSCARPRLVGDADHGCGEERPVDGRAEADVSVKDGRQVGRCTWSRRAGRRLRGRAVVQIDRQCDGSESSSSDAGATRRSSPSARAASRRRSRRRAR